MEESYKETLWEKMKKWRKHVLRAGRRTSGLVQYTKNKEQKYGKEGI